MTTSRVGSRPLGDGQTVVDVTPTIEAASAGSMQSASIASIVSRKCAAEISPPGPHMKHGRMELAPGRSHAECHYARGRHRNGSRWRRQANIPPAANETLRRFRSRVCSSAIRP
jgi:hypothetical protein